MPAVQANASNTVALWPGLAASTGAYLKRLDVLRRLLVPLLLTSVTGGAAGSLLLLKTPQHVFLRLVPWLLLAGTLLFAFGNTIRTVAGRSAAATDLRSMSWQVITATCFVELLIAIYGDISARG